MANQYLTQVNPNLSAIGSEEDLLYYSAEQVKVSSVEFGNRVGKYKRSLNSLNFGGTSEVKIPNWDFVSNVYLQATISGIPLAASLPDGWLFASIRSISYTWGTSNNSLLKIDRYDLIHHNILSCETKEKKSRMLELSGVVKEEGEATTSATAQILLKFPWSKMSKCQKRKAYDSRLLNDPIVLTIEFNDSTKFMGYANSIASTIPTAFSSAQVLLKQNELSNHADSLATEMMRDSSLKYNFPFVHLQTGTQNRFNVPSEDVDYEIRTQLLGFLSTDLIGILFSVVRSTDETKPTDGHINPLYLWDVQNVRLEYNGQILMDYPGNMLSLDMLTQDIGDDRFDFAALDRTTGQEPTTLPKQGYVYYLQFTQHKNLSFMEEFNNTESFSSQPLDLIFTFNTDIPTTNVDHILHTTYLYNAYTSTSAGTTRVMIG